jgi:hypothetical protein
MNGLSLADICSIASINDPIAKSAPQRASASAMALPMPVPPPVTQAALPLREPSAMASLLFILAVEISIALDDRHQLESTATGSPKAVSSMSTPRPGPGLAARLTRPLATLRGFLTSA